MRINASFKLKLRPNFKSFNALHPNITGTARKKVNSAATSRERPRISAPIIVDPERDVPGIIERVWNNPIKRAVLYVIL